MQPPARDARVLRFGAYEVDLQEGELRKSGIRIKLQDQPFQILVLLLGHQGRTVTREELRQRLWPADTFVDFNHGLNTAVKKLREALGDDSEHPRFIETLHRRGYRFVAQVIESSDGSMSEVSSGGQLPDAEVGRVSDEVQPRARTWPFIVAVLGALALAAMLLSVARFASVPRVVDVHQVTSDGFVKVPNSIVSDGERLYFTETVEGHEVLAEVAVGGGDTRTLPVSLPNIALDDISPDGSELLMASFFAWGPGTGWTLPLPAGALRRTGDLRFQDATYSPDGKELVYAQGRSLYRATATGTEIHKLVTLPVTGFPGSPRFSPDGRRLRFTVGDAPTGTSALWEMTADGGNLHPLLPHWRNHPHECCGRWSADGRYFFFQSTRPNGSQDVWVLPERDFPLIPPRPEPVQLTSGPLAFSHPMPSRDGKRLFVLGMQERAELERFDGKSGFVPYLSGMSAGQVDFSRDGQWLTYIRYPDGTLWRSSIDGTDQLQLTQPPMVACMPRWSPDEKSIIFVAATANSESLKMFIISAAGGLPRQVLDEPLGQDDPTWSPDGNSVLFIHSPETPTAAEKSSIATIDLRTRKVSPLPESGHLVGPRWSPDGRYIAAISWYNDELKIFDRNTGAWRALAHGEFNYPNWSHDGKYLYAENDALSPPEIVRVRISNGQVERVVRLRDLRRPSVPYGGLWSGLAPDNSVLIMRDSGVQEIYALDLQLP